MTVFYNADELFPLKLGTAITDRPPVIAVRPWLTYINWVWTDAFTFRLSNTGPISGAARIQPFSFAIRMAAHQLSGAGSFTSDAFPTLFGSAKGAGASALDVDATVPA